MAITKEVSVIYSRTINLGNFESVRIELGEVVTLEKADSAEEVRKEAFTRVKSEVSAQVKTIKEKIKR